MFGGIANWLKKRVDDVQGAFGVSNTAQTFKTNVAKPAPAQTISRPQVQQRPNMVQSQQNVLQNNPVRQPQFNLNQSLQNNGVNTPKITQPKTTQQLVNESYGTGLSSVLNRAKDVVNPNTNADKIKRQAATGLNENYAQEQERKTKAVQENPSTRNSANQFAASGLREVVNFGAKAPGAVANLGGAIVQSKNPIVKTLRSTIPVLNAAGNADSRLGGEGGKLIQRQGQNLNKFVDNKVTQSPIGERKNENKWAVGAGSAVAQLPLQIATGGVGLVNTGLQTASDEYNAARKAGKTNDQSLGIGTLQGGASALSEKFGIDRFIPGKGNTGSLLTKAAKSFITEGTQEAQQQFTQNLIANKTYDPSKSLIEGVGESFVLGGLAGSGTSLALDGLNRPKAPTTPSFTPEDLSVMKDISNAQMNPQAYTPREQAILQDRAIDLNRRTGLDLVSGSRADINERAGQAIEGFQNSQPRFNPIQASGSLIERAKSRLTPLNQGGYAQIPLGKDFTNDLSPKQTEFINDYAEMLESMGSGNGVQVNPETGSRISNNVRSEDIRGKNMTKYDWFEKARSEIESGNAMYGASEDYKSLPTTVTPETVSRGNIKEALAPKPVSYIPRSLNDFDRMIGGTGDIESEIRNDAATMSTVGKDAKALLESIQGDNEVTKAARKAMEDGSELHYYAKKDANGRSVGIERFNPKNMKIEAGFVTDNDGNVLGNHIKVDDTGIQTNVGGNLVNLNSVIGNPLDWQGHYRISETMERNIKRNAPTPEVAEKTQRFVIAAKTKREAQFREELQAVRNEFAQLDKATMAVKPKGVDDKAYRADLMDYFENNMSDQDFKGKYGEAAFTQATVAKNKTRSTYDQLLDRVNDEFGKFGEKQVDRRKDYITHINELNGRPSFAGELYGRLQNSILGEGSAQNRSGLPGDIAGRTENFEPRKRWNQFFQARKGGEYTKDPFKAIDAYLEPSLYNIHMTEPAVRARAVESAFRTAEQIKNTTSEGLTKQLNDSLARYRDTTGNTKLVKGFQEYANALAGKTQKLDRDIIDMSKSTELGLRGWQSLQGIAGKATILGNINSVVSQTLGLPSAVADAGVKNYAKGIAASISNDGSIKKSPFIKARETNVDSRFRSKTQKVMNVGGIPIQVVELAMVKQTWQAEHAKVKSEGYKGMDAVLEADRRTERVVAGRGIADKPEMYRSTAMNGLMQYTLEAEAQFKNFTQDLNPIQKATFIVAAFAMNSLSELVTGNTPLPDFLGAAIDSLGDIFGDDKEGAEKLTSPLQRFASEAVSFNPLVTAGVNALTTKDMRKSLFGEDSNLGRYDGTSAPVQVIKNAYNAVDSAANGEWTNARNEALKDLPFGNQIRKSLTGLEANMRGSAVDKSGEKTFETGKNAGSQLRNFVFGANSTKEAREYYDQPKRAESKPTGGNLLSTDELLKEQMSSPEQQDFLKLKSDEQKELAKSDPKAKAWLEQIKTTKRINADDVERPEGLSAESKRILEWDNKRTQEQKNRLQYTQNDYDYKLAKAKYEQDKLKGNVSRAEQINRDQSLKKAEIGSQFSKDTREAYNSLTKAELQAYAEQDPNGNQIWNDAVAYGDKLVEAGLLKKNKLRTASKGGGRKGKGGRKGTTAKYKSGAGSSNDISKKLQLLAGVGSSKSKTSTSPRKHTAKLKGVRSA